MSVLTNLQSKFGSPNGSVWHSSMPLLILPLNPSAFLLSLPVLTRLSVLHCPSSQKPLKPEHGAIFLRVSSVLRPPLDQMCACFSCPGKMSLLLPDVFIQPWTCYLKTTKKECPYEQASGWMNFISGPRTAQGLYIEQIFLDRVLRNEPGMTGLLLFYTAEL